MSVATQIKKPSQVAALLVRLERLWRLCGADQTENLATLLRGKGRPRPNDPYQVCWNFATRRTDFRQLHRILQRLLTKPLYSPRNQGLFFPLRGSFFFYRQA